MDSWNAAQGKYYDDFFKLSMQITDINEKKSEITVYSVVPVKTVVDQDIRNGIIEINLTENRQAQKFRRHNIPYEDFRTYDPTDYISPIDYICEKEEIETLYKALDTLTLEQQHLIFEIFWKKRSQTDIAKDYGVSKVAIHKKLKKIISLLKKYFQDQVNFWLISDLISEGTNMFL